MFAWSLFFQQFGDGFSEFLDGEGFSEELYSGGVEIVLGEYVVAIAGDEQDLAVRVVEFYLFSQLMPVNTGHDNVGDE